MKKVLFIAYLYPPIANSGTRRSLEFVNRLPDNGWEPIVLTTVPKATNSDPSLLKEVRDGTRIERVPLWTDRLADSIRRLSDSPCLADGLRWRLQRLMQVPDECAAWKTPSVEKGLALFAEQEFDAIYASGWPWTSFLVASELGHKTGIPFVVDYRDLWRPSDAQWDQHTRLQSWLQPRLEKKILDSAAAVVTTTPSFARMLEALGTRSKVYSITNGFNPEDFATRFSPPKTESRCLISYTGVWRPGYNPEDLYRAIRRLRDQGQEDCLKRLKVTMAGFKPGNVNKYAIGDIVEELGFVPHAQAVDIMMNSDALYLPVSGGIYDKASLPGKLFEYVGSSRPIIASAQADSEVSSALERTGGACIVRPGDIEHLAKAIQQLVCGNVQDLFSERCENEARLFERGNQATELANVLNMVAQKLVKERQHD